MLHCSEFIYWHNLRKSDTQFPLSQNSISTEQKDRTPDAIYAVSRQVLSKSVYGTTKHVPEPISIKYYTFDETVHNLCTKILESLNTLKEYETFDEKLKRFLQKVYNYFKNKSVKLDFLMRYD
ncbi:hypothetical protein K501DRAFT_277392 [Backusella circina FSU 941]|nr:hypothetical protein K501DRAFT_277392 [Backusella circina FSU 941]